MSDAAAAHLSDFMKPYRQLTKRFRASNVMRTIADLAAAATQEEVEAEFARIEVGCAFTKRPNGSKRSKSGSSVFGSSLLRLHVQVS
jgi:hypothetical protein